MRRLNSYEVIEIRWQSGIENFVREKKDDFIFNYFRNFKPVKKFQNRSYVLEFWGLDNSSSKSILDVLEFCIFESCCLSPIRINSVLEELRDKRLEVIAEVIYVRAFWSREMLA